MEADVAVVGGGPAGACCAAKLAGLGLDVVLFEKPETTRQHTGESLPSSARVLLDALGLELPDNVLVERPPEHLVYWGEMDGAGPARRDDQKEASFLVWRGPFDDALRRHAEAEGVRRVQTVFRGDERTRFRFLVDASGRAGVFSRATRRREPELRTTALTAHFQPTEPDGPTMVESFADGYVWSAPLRNGLRDVTVMTQPGTEYRAALDACRHVNELVVDEPVDTLRGIDATPYTSERFCDGAALRCGDAASFLDPLSAHGLHKAMDSGLVGAVVVRTILERPERAADAARFYDERERSIYEVTAERLGRLYASETRFRDRAFWKARSRVAPPVAPSPPRVPLRAEMKLRAAAGARIEDAPVLVNDFIELAPVLVAPHHDRPVRFLGAVSLPDLFRAAVSADSAGAAARAADAPFDDAYRAVDWLYRSGYLIE